MSPEQSVPSSTLWLVHRETGPRHTLARRIGLPPESLVIGAPDDAVFASASAPVALVIAPLADFEAELDFVHRHREALADARRLFLADAGQEAEVRRLFAARTEELAPARPDPRRLRELATRALAHRNAAPLSARRERERIASRFSAWFGAIEIPGMLRVLDPALASLPLLVRGVPGSGRRLAARYAELFRAADPSARTLQIDAREVADAEALWTRIARAARTTEGRVGTIRIDEIDALPPSAQRALCEWIRLGVAPETVTRAFDAADPGERLRFVATAGPSGSEDRLDPQLAGAFAPLGIAVPSLLDRPEALGPFADQVLDAWSARVGGGPRSLTPEALSVLEGEAWSGDRSAVEATLQTALASTSSETLDASDLEQSSAAVLLATAPFARETEPESETASREDAGSTTSENEDADARQRFADAPVIPPIASTEDLESAFLEGMPETDQDEGAEGFPEAEGDDGAEDLPAAEQDDGAHAEATPAGDVSTELGAETFRAARHSTSGATDTKSQAWRRLARSLSHEIRNPLVSIRTFAELLPEHFEDPSFRERFTELVGRDVAHIDEVIGRLATAAAQEKVETAPIDVSAMLERLLDERRESIGQRRLLVLRELERDAPIAWADANSLEVALAGVLDRALASLPERGDLFVATRRIERSADGTPRLRVLLRHHNPELGGGDASGLEEVAAAANALEYVLAETIVEASGGQLTVDATDAHETLILVDLRTPA